MISQHWTRSESAKTNVYERTDKFSVWQHEGHWRSFTPSGILLTETKTGKPLTFESANAATTYVDNRFMLPGMPIFNGTFEI